MNTHIESTNLDPLMQGEATAAVLPTTPQQRVDASRAALQLWILRTYHPEQLQPDHAGPPAPAPEDDGEPPWMGVMVDALSDVPMASVGVRYVRRWWARHPIHASLNMAEQAGRDALRPIVNQHPWLVLVGAVALGVGVARLKPWRWISGKALLSGLLPPISIASVLASVTAMVDAKSHADKADNAASAAGHAASTADVAASTAVTSAAAAATGSAPPVTDVPRATAPAL